MGQYWIPVNLDKREYIRPHALGCGLKLWEQLANHPGTGAALLILTAAMPIPRGGGDFDLDENWHGPERKFPEHGITPGPMPDAYPVIAKRTIGRWAGDRIAIVGDYAEAGDLAPEHQADRIYRLCQSADEFDPEDYEDDDDAPTRDELFTDVTADVRAVIEHELHGRYEGEGWARWKREERQ